MLQSVLLFIRKDKWTTIQKCTCVHDQTHQQTDRNSIDAERKSNESHAAHLLLFFFSTSSSKRFSFTMQFRTLSISVASLYYYFTRCSVVELYCQLTQHSTKRNRTSCHRVFACAVFFWRTSLPSNCYCSLCVCQCIELCVCFRCRNRVCALVTLNRLVGRSFYIFVLWHFL